VAPALEEEALVLNREQSPDVITQHLGAGEIAPASEAVPNGNKIVTEVLQAKCQQVLAPNGAEQHQREYDAALEIRILKMMQEP
jgi:hypothetical protein